MLADFNLAETKNKLKNNYCALSFKQRKTIKIKMFLNWVAEDLTRLRFFVRITILLQFLGDITV